VARKNPKTKKTLKRKPVRQGANYDVTHGGAVAVPAPDAEAQLRRSVLSCLLWEDEHYENGENVAARITKAAQDVPVSTLAKLSVEARSEYNLRHVPLLLLKTLVARGNGEIVRNAIRDTIQRADELSEFVALYWKDGKRPLSAQMKKGLALAFRKFDAYQLGKYNSDNAIKLRDVLFMCHAKPKDKAQQKVWQKLIDGKLESPDTWEVNLSSGEHKREVFERLMAEEKLGYMALLRNLAGMEKAGVPRKLVKEAILARLNGADRVLPFRFITAARAAPMFEDALDTAMQATMKQMPKMLGHTVIVIDVSGSMNGRLSAQGTLDRMDAAAALAAICRGMAEDCTVFATAGNDGTRVHKTAELSTRGGMALIEEIKKAGDKLGGGGIFLKQMCDYVKSHVSGEVDRLIVVTDEQDCDYGGRNAPSEADAFGKRNYLINVANYKHGIGYGDWTHIDGFSEQALKYIAVSEAYNIPQN
jgi:60 kDa SS-A/Ro ribonucleoprotein